MTYSQLNALLDCLKLPVKQVKLFCNQVYCPGHCHEFSRPLSRSVVAT